MEYIYKLGNRAVSFTDVRSGICITKNNPHTTGNPLHLTNGAFARAVGGGHIFMEVIEEKAPTAEELLAKKEEQLSNLDVLTASEEEMSQFTRNEIMEKFSFIDDDDEAKAVKYSKKAEAIKFLISIRDDYELDN